jgi:hypothetical protein
MPYMRLEELGRDEAFFRRGDPAGRLAMFLPRLIAGRVDHGPLAVPPEPARMKR